MSESTEPTEPAGEVEEEAPVRKPMSEERLRQLQAARAKALEKRRLLAELAAKEKAMKEQALQERIQKVKAFEEKKQEPPKKKKSPPPPPVEESETEEEEEEEEEESEEEEVPPPPPPRRVKRAPPRMSDDRMAAEIARDQLRQKVAQANLEAAFRSIFPLHHGFHSPF